MHSARTVPQGKNEITISYGYDYNEMADQRGNSANNVIVQFGLRRGISENTDFGIRNFFLLGGLADFKWRFVHGDRLDLAVDGGIGAAFIDATVVHVPVHAIASYQVSDWFIPSAALGYGAFWISGYQTDSSPPPNAQLVPWQWHGDGMLVLHAGLEFTWAPVKAFALEYVLLKPVLDNEGDQHQFVTNHLFVVGHRF